MAPTKTALIPISTKITDAFIILLGASLFGLSILEAYFYGGVFRSHSGLELSTVIGLILVAALLTRLTPLSPFIKRSTSLLLLYFPHTGRGCRSYGCGRCVCREPGILPGQGSVPQGSGRASQRGSRAERHARGHSSVLPVPRRSG